MPRFFFDIVDGGLTVDDVGLDFADAHAARDVALKTLPAVARDEIGDGTSHEVSVLIRDEDNRALFMASLTFTAKWLVDTA